MQQNASGEPSTLRALLLGKPLDARCDAEAVAADARAINTALTRHLLGVCALLERLHGAARGDPKAAVTQAIRELRAVARAPVSATAITCKRAALLFALHHEPEVRCHFEAASGGDTAVAMAAGLATPLFERHMCQNPAAYVTLCAVLAEMWHGERVQRSSESSESFESPESVRAPPDHPT